MYVLIFYLDAVYSPVVCAPSTIGFNGTVTCTYQYFAQILIAILLEVYPLNITYNLTDQGTFQKIILS